LAQSPLDSKPTEALLKQRFRLEEFRQIDKAISIWPLWLQVIIRGWMLWLEDKVIEIKITGTVNQAIEEYNKLIPPEPTLTQPIITEKPSEIEGLPELRITAPWHESTNTGAGSKDT
jgi:hypothetical protein